MSKFADKYNNGVHFEIDTKGFDYLKLSDLSLKTWYPIKAVYINTKSKFGESPVVATDKAFVNMPQHMLDTFKDMRNDSELLDLINKGLFGFEIYEYTNKYGVAYGVNFVDSL